MAKQPRSWALGAELGEMGFEPPRSGPWPELSPVGLFPLSQPVPPPARLGAPPRPGSFSHGPTCGAGGAPLKGQEARGWRSRRQTLPPWSGFPWPPISHLPRVLFLSFFEGFLPCAYFLLFFKIRRKYPENGHFTRSTNLIFPVLPMRVGETRPLSRDPLPSLPRSVFRVPCLLGRPVFALDHIALFACARGRCLSGAWSSCVLPPPAL